MKHNAIVSQNNCVVSRNECISFEDVCTHVCHVACFVVLFGLCVSCVSGKGAALLNYKKIEKILQMNGYDFTFMILGNLNGQTGKTP